LRLSWLFAVAPPALLLFPIWRHTETGRLSVAQLVTQWQAIAHHRDNRFLAEGQHVRRDRGRKRPG